MASSWPLLAAAELDTCGFDSTTPYEKLVVSLLPVTKKLSTADLCFEGGEGHDVVEGAALGLDGLPRHAEVGSLLLGVEVSAQHGPHPDLLLSSVDSGLHYRQGARISSLS